jgi:hypothetical protein
MPSRHLLSDEDRAMLTELLSEARDPDEEERFRVGPFQDMLSRGLVLTDKQRNWLRVTHERITGKPNYVNAFSAGSVPRGKEVPTPEVLKHRPLKPPMKKEI